jgi:hypothetical protein
MFIMDYFLLKLILLFIAIYQLLKKLSLLFFVLYYFAFLIFIPLVLCLQQFVNGLKKLLHDCSITASQGNWWQFEIFVWIYDFCFSFLPKWRSRFVRPKLLLKRFDPLMWGCFLLDNFIILFDVCKALVKWK